MASDEALEGLSRDPRLWAQRISLNLSLMQAMTVQGYLLLALRHPDVRALDETRQTVEETVAILSRMLVHAGAMTEDTLRGCFMLETSAGSMTWGDFEAACARLDARVAAMGQRNPDAG